MNPGEYRFTGIKYTDINRPLFGKLYASAFYSLEDKFVLEILAPHSLMDRRECEEEQTDLNNGERWAQNKLKYEGSKWPLDNVNYYIEINGRKIGEGSVISTGCRYEPERNEENVAEKENIEENKTLESSSDKALDESELKVARTGIDLPKISIADSLDEIFKDFQNYVIDSLKELEVFDLEDTNIEETSRKFDEERDKKERAFFSKFRDAVVIPDYLEREAMLISDIGFREKDFVLENGKINSLKFIVRSKRKYYLVRKKFNLKFGENIKTLGNDSEEWGKFADKIIVEDIVESRRDDGIIKNIPVGKKAVLIKYETLYNTSAYPIFYTTETLLSNEFPDFCIDSTKLLDEKGKNGFDKYATIIGYVDEEAEGVEFELFDLMIDFECNNEYVLI